jgi:membrane associated rhomboid family serine protease
MIPLRDVIPSRTFPLVTLVLLGFNAAFYLHQQWLDPQERSDLAEALGVVPAALSIWTLITSEFVHRDPVQFASNVVMLWLLGETLEDRLGRGRYLMFYMLCGALAAGLHVWTYRHSLTPAVGASGAVAGIMGGYCRLYPGSRILTLVPLPVAWPILELPVWGFIAAWVVAQLVSEVVPFATGIPSAQGFSPASCLVAFLAGALLVGVFRRSERMRVEWWHDANKTGPPYA